MRLFFSFFIPTLLAVLLGAVVFLPVTALGQNQPRCLIRCGPIPYQWENVGPCNCETGLQRQEQYCHFPCDECTVSNGITTCEGCPACPDGTTIYRNVACRCSGGGSGYLFANPIKHDTIGELLLAVVNGVTVILMPIIVLGIAFMGFRMVLAGHEKNADYTKWKSAFAWSLVGLFLVLGARGVIFVIQNTINDVLQDEYKVGDP